MKNNIYYLLEYSSLVFVLSYLTLHSIQLVFVGISLSLYLINKSIIDKSLKIAIKNEIFIPKSKKSRSENLLNKNLELYKSNNITSLAERVEELGFIPSEDADDNSDAA